MEINVVIRKIEKSAVQLTNLILIIVRNIRIIYKTTGLSRKMFGIKTIEEFVVELTMLILTIHFCLSFLSYIFQR